MDYTEKLTVLQYALEQYTNWDEGQDIPESVIEAFVAKIVVSKDGFDWYLRFDGDPDKPLHCQLQGKRKQTTKIMVAGDISPAVNNGTTGCYQGLILNNNDAPVLRNRGIFLYLYYRILWEPGRTLQNVIAFVLFMRYINVDILCGGLRFG